MRAYSPGGTDIGATVNKGGVLYVHSGGTAANTTVKSGGREVLETGGVTTGTTVISSGGALELNGALPSSVTYKPGAILEVGPAAVLQGGPLPTGVATAIILPGATQRRLGQLWQPVGDLWPLKQRR